jgi:hypothetical protein
MKESTCLIMKGFRSFSNQNDSETLYNMPAGVGIEVPLS